MREPVSIVMPVYNEEQIIEKVVKEYHEEIIKKIQGSEFIIINDRSTDSTAAILAKLAHDLPGLHITHLPKNVGHGQALGEGLRRAKNPLIFHVDSDNQFKAEDFWKLYALCEDNDIVVGWRRKRHDAFRRTAISALLRMTLLILFGMKVRDANSPFKCIRTEAMRDIARALPPHPFAISVLILIVAKRKGYRVREVAVTHFARTTGKSTLANPLFLFKSCCLCFRDILKLR